MKHIAAVRRFLSFFLVFFLLLCSYLPQSFSEGIDADALFIDGQRYLTGDGVEQDLVNGIAMIVAAATAGSSKAMVQVGVMCNSGFGKLISPETDDSGIADLALSWYEKAAQAGEVELAAEAISRDAFSYFLGSDNGVIQEDDAVALKYFQKASEYGDPDAINMMVAFYTYGFGVEQDPNKALELGSRLADKGDTEALLAMEENAYAYYAGTKDGIEINFTTAFNYYLKLTEYSNERAMYNVGLLYEYGLGVTADHDKAIEWLTKALDAGYAPAKEMLEQLTSN